MISGGAVQHAWSIKQLIWNGYRPACICDSMQMGSKPTEPGGRIPPSPGYKRTGNCGPAPTNSCHESPPRARGRLSLNLPSGWGGV